MVLGLYHGTLFDAVCSWCTLVQITSRMLVGGVWSGIDVYSRTRVTSSKADVLAGFIFCHKIARPWGAAVLLQLVIVIVNNIGP